jgi:prepilin-type N-terminal cleavage/methylation domain-containing protein
MKRRAGSAGFTLIEVLVALFVFLTAVTGILALMTTALAMHRDGLQIASASRQLDDVVAQMRRELAAGKYRGADGERLPVAPFRLADGTWVSLGWEPAHGEEPPIALLRVSGTQAGLKTASILRVVLSGGPLPADEAGRLQAARARPREQP